MAMKKVRYAAAAAVGMVPALGLMVPAANAATVVTHAPGSPGKTVSLRHRAIRWSTAMPLIQNRQTTMQGADLTHSQKGLTERTRFYSGGGRLEHTTWQAGHIFRGFTSWYSLPNIYAHEVCQALVANSNHTM
ncbi:MAG TPA: hypothetical protein VIJ82_23665 [Streptosporangiaceae bacterium]